MSDYRLLMYALVTGLIVGGVLSLARHAVSLARPH